MANRSDFHTAKLPRYLKRALASGEANGFISDAHQRGEIKRSLISAHANHVRFKMKRAETRDIVGD
jgi:hypothetical protein